MNKDLINVARLLEGAARSLRDMAHEGAPAEPESDNPKAAIMRRAERETREYAFQAARLVHGLHAQGDAQAAAQELPELVRLVRNLRMQADTRKAAGDTVGFEERRAAHHYYNEQLKSLRRGPLGEDPAPYPG